MPVEEMPIEEFYGTKKPANAGFCIPNVRESWRSKDISGMPVKLWNVPGGSRYEGAPLPVAKKESLWDYATPAHLEVEFLGHAAKWERDTRYISSMNDVVNHPSYKQIIAMGRAKRKEMLALLLRDLKENERPWFTALAQIAGINPANPDDAGRLDRMTKAWLGWGAKEGLI